MIIGYENNDLKAIGPGERSKTGRFQWVFECRCGKRITRRSDLVTSGQVKSCGCRRVRVNKEKGTTHGFCSRGKIVPEYTAWQNMIARCGKKSHPNWYKYGGRGIKVCSRWRNFANFMKDMGKRPGKGFTIERIDNSLGYEPGNCKWASYAEQNRNTRRNVILTFNGESKCLMDWSLSTGISYSALRKRIALGWSLEDTLRRKTRC